MDPRTPVRILVVAAALGAGSAAAQMGTPSYQGLWWRSPAGAESGWGVNLAHQGDILFATWFTYDRDGSGMWLVMPAGARVDAGPGDTGYEGYGYGMMMGTPSYSGTLYRTTGPAFDSMPFNPSAVGVTEVGSATFQFSGAHAGVFAWTVDGVSRSGPIERQVYGSPMPSCEIGGARGAVPSYQDLWWGAPAGAESGWGVNITHQGDTLFATWFTYGANGRGQWLVMSNGARTGPGTYSGTLYRTRGPAFDAEPWNGSQVQVAAAGSATFTFADPDHGTFAYTLDGVSQAKAIVRQVYSDPPTVCRMP